MLRLLRSLEGFRLTLITLALALPLVAAALLFYQMQTWVILAWLMLGSTAVVFSVLLFSRNLSQVLRSNTQCARDMVSGKYSTFFEFGSHPGLIGGNQTALREMLIDLKHKLSLSQGVMNSMVTPYVVTDVNEVFISGNPALIRMLEHEGKPEQYYGQDVSMFFYGEKRQTVLGLAMRDKKSISKEVEFTGRKGGKRFIHIDASPLFDIEGNMMGALCIYTDLSEIRVSEAKLSTQNEMIFNSAARATDISNAMATAAEELAAQVEEASRGADEQRSRTTETATAMEEMNATVLEVAKNASQAAEASAQASMKAQDGTKIVGESVAAINQVQKQSLELKNNLGKLGQQAEQIGRIMNVIEDIADQTNLLALNAAIEAARAGDAGRGFAVVADEVRKLAEKTMNATKEVGQAIADIQQGTRTNIESMDHAAAAIAEATSRANASGEALQEILRLAELAADQVRSIATAAEQQSATSEEINRGVDDINRISSETSDVMNQSAEAVSNLAQMAVQLHTIIDEMKKQ
ncbi:methyl-accepting chemotaxis sensory transducer with Pas/Pac sensor [Desulfonatronum thiosulfatophilum]|uniref:Methyl-accepting chemotaxis sensory transducer with Pas/Pac sensor n=1 Tax=Desulfonatronum thiosulfatophilum TaxID=617002 RepID=A0A1G6DPZ6_9BACT|nr:methyl-accepting chemotaxis protein [Desulfonatronum thiosulfatophilum]SDB47254.1 methyl-accepting chemotaxis sensory transducer with Pas/Pac sensor [Desulfonatronum thiosulfatophilum]